MGYRFIFFVFLLIFSCQKDSDKQDLTASCNIIGYENSNYILRNIKTSRENVNLVITNQTTHLNQVNNYILNNDTINLYLNSFNYPEFQFVYDRRNNLIYFKFANSVDLLATYWVKSNRIVKLSLKGSPNDTNFYFYDSSGYMTKNMIMKNNKLVTTTSYEYFKDYNYLDFYNKENDKIAVLSYMFNLEYRDALKSKILIDSISNINIKNYKIEYNQFKFPDKLVTEKDTIYLNNLCK